MYTCLRKKSFTSWLCDVPVGVNENSAFQYFAVLLYHFSGSETPWLINKFCLLRFSMSLTNGILIIKFDALTTRKIIFKQHIKYVSVKLLFFCCFLSSLSVDTIV